MQSKSDHENLCTTVMYLKTLVQQFAAIFISCLNKCFWIELNLIGIGLILTEKYKEKLNVLGKWFFQVVASLPTKVLLLLALAQTVQD
jgi:hypothetical protein